MNDLLKAISVRQPWAWAIIHAGKDMENRSAASIRHMNFTGINRIAIHAAKGMTRDEYDDASRFMRESLGIACPHAIDLARGGIIGTVRVVDIVNDSKSPWFFGPRAIVLAEPQSCDFIPSIGSLGLFNWTPADPIIVPPPARWMHHECQSIASPHRVSQEQDLLI